jgi:spore coat protein U-like protein
MKVARFLKPVLVALSVAAVGAFLSTMPVSAGSKTANLSVTASVANNCTITTAVVAFGAYDPIVTNASTPLDNNGTVSITCTKKAATTIGLGLGAHASGSVRRMVNADDVTEFLTYELYKDSPGGAVWGNSGSDLLTPPVAPSKAQRDFTVYGRVPAGQDVSAAAFSDSVVATVNY